MIGLLSTNDYFHLPSLFREPAGEMQVLLAFSNVGVGRERLDSGGSDMTDRLGMTQAGLS